MSNSCFTTRQHHFCTTFSRILLILFLLYFAIFFNKVQKIDASYCRCALYLTVLTIVCLIESRIEYKNDVVKPCYFSTLSQVYCPILNFILFSFYIRLKDKRRIQKRKKEKLFVCKAPCPFFFVFK